MQLAEKPARVWLRSALCPASPHTGYGYIRCGDSVSAGRRVEAFTEKPDLATAERFLQSGDYLWNSGMFLFHSDLYLNQLKALHPEMAEHCRLSVEHASADLDFIRLDKASFERCEDISVDYALLEPLCGNAGDQVSVIPLDAGWDDIGSWTSVRENSPRDEDGNALSGDVMAFNASNCLVRSENKLVAAVGVKDLVIVDTKDALLVAHQDDVQNVRKVVDKLREGNRDEYSMHREVFRPWGVFDTLNTGDRYKVKHIRVNPGACLSLQMHHHRAEHWVVVSGTARVTIADNVFLLTENESAYIPVGEKHSLENPGKVPLELIEVQTGTYLGEDDVIRLEDKYGRTE